MPEESSASQMQVIIMSSDDNIPSFKVSYEPSWTVSTLKAHLCNVHPVQPSPTSQRLIFAGKLLEDSCALLETFRNSEGTPVVHLVCQGTKTQTSISSGNGSISENNVQDMVRNLSGEELQHYQLAYYQYLQQFYLNSLASSGGVAAQNCWLPALCASQLPWNFPAVHSPYRITPSTENVQPQSSSSAQPVGLRQRFLQNARNFFSARGDRVQPAVGRNEGDGENPDQAVLDNQAAPQQNAIDGFIADAGIDGAGDPGGGVDILDRFYMLFRLGLFICLCVAYSSLDKAIIVFSVIVYVYLYNIYRRYAAVDRAVQQLQQLQQQQPPAQQAEAGNSSEMLAAQPPANGFTENMANSNQDTSEGSSQVVAEPLQETSRIHRMRSNLRFAAAISFQFVSTLLTSLIPEQPPPVQLN